MCVRDVMACEEKGKVSDRKGWGARCSSLMQIDEREKSHWTAEETVPRFLNTHRHFLCVLLLM